MTTDVHRLQRLPTSPEESRLAREELERVLSNTHLRGSKRYPAMLRHVVEQTLAGKQSELKERTIGIEVFGRNPGYDTNSDPVVRFSAGEIRKRLAQIYAEDIQPPKVRFELPLGTYVPLLLWESEEAESATAGPSLPAEVIAAEPDAPLPRESPASRRLHLRRVVLLSSLAMALLVALFLLLRAVPTTHDAVAKLWKPLFQQKAPLVMSVGQPAQGPQLPIPAGNMSINQHLVQPSFRVSIPTAHVIAEIGGYLRAQHQEFGVHGAELTSLSDLYERPVVLVGAIDNKWTLNLLQTLPYRFVSSGTMSFIEDSSRPTFRKWRLDFSQPYMKQTVDYAILARFMSPVTNAPVLVIAGIGANGNEAAAEFSLSQNELRTLFKQAPTNWKGTNFEAVLRVDVIGGDTGGATVVASKFW